MIKFKLEQKQLQEAIRRLGHVVKGNNTLPVLEYIHVKAEKSRITLTSTNLEITIQHYIDCNIEGDGQFLLPFVELKKIVALEVGEIEFKIEKNVPTLICEKDVIVFGDTGSADDFPAWPEIKEKNKFEINGEFLPSLLTASLSVGEDELRPAMLSVLAELNRDSISIVSTDACTLYERVLAANLPSDKESLLIPPIVSKVLAEYTSTKIGFNDAHVAFESDNTIVYARRADAKFPDYKSVLREFTPNVQVSLQELQLALDKTIVVSNDVTNMIGLTIFPDKIEVSANNMDTNMYARTSIGGNAQGCDTGEIHFNGKLLSRCLKQLANHADENAKINLSILGPTRGVMLRVEGKDDLNLLIMPVSINN